MMKLFKCLWISLGLLLIQEMVNGVEENVALGQPCTQSSTFDLQKPGRAVDGVLETYGHTNTETDPWWRVDLMRVYRVYRVAITNKVTESYYSRINGAVIRVGNFLDIYNNTICAVISTIPSGATANFSCGGLEGRYVILHIPGDQKILTFRELEVYGYLADYSDTCMCPCCEEGNLALDGAATQSSTSGDWFAENAIDGNRGLQQLYTGCSSTLNQTNPWWKLDLRYVYRVSDVVVTNRRDCCAEQINGAEIRIGNSLENNGSNNPICAVIPDIPAGESYNYSCGGMEGRYVNLIIPGDMKTLTICELEVYGEGPVLIGSILKMQFYSSNDLTDPSMRENVLKQLGSALADRGLTNMTLRWYQTPKLVIQGNNAERLCVKEN